MEKFVTCCWIKWFLISVLLWIVNCEGPPQIPGSYFAVGEIVNTLDGSQTMQMAFEETYDSDQQKTAFKVWTYGHDTTIVEDLKSRQTYQYAGESCQPITLAKWLKLETPPDLLTYEDTNGTVRFSLRQLFMLDNKYIRPDDNNVSDVFRGVPARKWTYNIAGSNPNDGDRELLIIVAYWSDGSLTVSSKDRIMPLGYTVTKLNFQNQPNPKVHEQFINVYNFQPGVSDQKLLEPIQGIYCENRTSNLEFPKPNNIQALALHTELVFPESLDIRYVDMWLDSKNKVLRVDTHKVRGEFEKDQSEHVIGPMGLTFRITKEQGLASCKVTSSKDSEFDVQDLFNFKLPVENWQIANLFGSDTTAYAYIGQTSKRDIPCHLFQGMRRDWPQPLANVTSLWEWCFSLNVTKNDGKVKFKNGEYGLVNAQVKIIDSPYQSKFTQGLVFIHHFYDVSRKDPALMSATNFDISSCFAPHQMRGLQFVVDWEVFEDNLHLVEKATADPVFLQRWKNMIYQHSGLQPYTLRVTNVKAVIEKDTLYIRFWLLNVHENIPHDIAKNEKSAVQAETDFRKNVDAGKVFISYSSEEGSKMRQIFAKKGSVDLQIHRDFKNHEFPDITQQPPFTTTKGYSFELLTEVDRTEPPVSTSKYLTSPPTAEVSSKWPTTLPDRNNLQQELFVGYHKGTVAGISMGLLIVGISIGLAGTYFRYKGLVSKTSTN